MTVSALKSISVVYLVYSIVIIAASVLMRRLRARIFVLISVTIVGIAIPAITVVNVIMEFEHIPEWPVLIPMWLGVPIAVWTTVVLIRRDIREAFAPLEGRTSTIHAAAAPPSIVQQVRGPATGLLITGILNWIGIPVVTGILTLTALHQDLHIPNPEHMVPAIALFMFIASGLMIFGALKMRKLEAYGAAITSSILAMIVSPGSVVGFPIGIWALVVLTRREVKAAFAARHTVDSVIGR